MDDLLLTIIGNYCFPIVACIAMAWYVKYITDKNSEETRLLNDNHSKEMLAFKDEIKQALDNNTLAINTLCEKLRIKEDL